MVFTFNPLATYGHDHIGLCRNIKVKDQKVQKIKWKETDGRTGPTASDFIVTITTTITISNCSSFTQSVTITKSKRNIKTILKLNQNTENYIRTVTKTMLNLKRFSKFNASCQVSKYLCEAEDRSLSTAHLSDPLCF